MNREARELRFEKMRHHKRHRADGKQHCPVEGMNAGIPASQRIDQLMMQAHRKRRRRFR